MSKNRRNDREGFTLIEVLLVMIILVILASFATLYVRGFRKRAFEHQAKIQIGLFEEAIDLYENDIHQYPTSSQGLDALIQAPGDLPNPERWREPYLKKVTQIPLDPWDSEYQYELLDEDNYRIWSNGPDGVSNSDDDISSDDTY